MLQVIEQTRDERMAMYMNLRKAELAEMLINCNEALDRLINRIEVLEADK